MRLRLATRAPGAGAAPSPSATASVQLRGRWLLAARLVWLGVASLSAGLFVAGLPAQFARLARVCPAAACASGQLQPISALALEEMGLSLTFFAGYAVALIVLFALAYGGVAALIFWRRSDDRLALFTSLALLTFGLVTFPGVASAFGAAHPAWRLPVAALNLAGSTMFILFLFLFPGVRFAPRWTRWIALVWIIQQIPQPLFPDSAFVVGRGYIVASICIWAAALGAILFTQIYRFRHISSAAQRLQTKWVVYGVSAASVGLIAGVIVLDILYPRPATPQQMLVTLIVDAVVYGALTLVPLSIGVAMLRSHLFDVDTLINRTLVYGALTAGVVAVYALVVGALGALFQARGVFLVALLGAGLVAVLFHPLREWLQRGVNRLMYGQRDEPYAVISRLSQQLEATLSVDAVLPAMVAAVAGALKLPYVAIALREDGQVTPAASYGAPVGELLRLPLVYQAEAVGEMTVAPRDVGEPWSPSDRRLLAELARQAGAAAQAVRLTAELQRSNARLTVARERLVSAREEERRRLRRDLHDGLGPALAALTLKVGAARMTLRRDPEATDALLVELGDDIQATVADIRRLVYNLRPPTLDELGLVGAIRERAARYEVGGGEGQTGALRVIVDAPERLPPLPAAVEVAAYRITQEALTNIARHAHASACHIHLTLDDSVHLEISDDGIGLPARRPAGIGLNAMRERAAELGGACVVESAAGGGTRVRISLPIPKEA